MTINWFERAIIAFALISVLAFIAEQIKTLVEAKASEMRNRHNKIVAYNGNLYSIQTVHIKKIGEEPKK